MFRAAGEARKTAMAAMSSGSLGRPRGITASRRRAISSTVRPSSRARTLRLASESAVIVVPGHTALTLMLWRTSWRAAIRVREITAPLLAADGVGGPRVALAGDGRDVDDRAAPAIISRATRCRQKNTP